MKLDLKTIGFLVVPPLLWAGNAVVGRYLVPLVSPILLNQLRWIVAALLLIAFWPSLWKNRKSYLANWKSFSLLGLLGMGCYNSLQYAALHTSSPINVTLVASSMPLWMLLIGTIFFEVKIRARDIAGVLSSFFGVWLVITRGHVFAPLSIEWHQGDILMLIAAIAWSAYSWLLVKNKDLPLKEQAWLFMLAQILWGIVWSTAFTVVESQWGGLNFVFEFGVIAAILFVSVGPSLLAYRCWGIGVSRAGPSNAGFFANLTPLFAAVLSGLIWAEWPTWFHLTSFAFIILGIKLSSR